MSYSSSSAITSSTMSSESAPRSSMKDASGVTSYSLTPSCSQMISITFCSTLAAIVLLLTWLSRPPASHVEATVHVEDVSGDVPRAGGSEKDDRRRDLVGRRHAPRRNDARVKALLRVAQRRHHVGLDESWRDGVDGDAARGDLARQRLREADHPGLGGGVRRLPRISHLRDDGGEIDDTAVMGPDHGPERPRGRATDATRRPGHDSDLTVELAAHASSSRARVIPSRSPTGTQGSAGSSRFRRPVSTRPGPTSSATVGANAMTARTVSSHRTGAVSCRTRSDATSTACVTTAAVTLLTRRIAGGRSEMPARDRAHAPQAGALR